MPYLIDERTWCSSHPLSTKRSYIFVSNGSPRLSKLNGKLILLTEGLPKMNMKEISQNFVGNIGHWPQLHSVMNLAIDDLTPFFESLLQSLKLWGKNELRVSIYSSFPAGFNNFWKGGVKKPFVFKLKGSIGGQGLGFYDQ